VPGREGEGWWAALVSGQRGQRPPPGDRILWTWECQGEKEKVGGLPYSPDREDRDLHQEIEYYVPVSARERRRMLEGCLSLYTEGTETTTRR
jgi:hypothetical protein